LAGPLEDICGLLVAESEQGQHLRQNSPFAGVLSPAEVWEIKNRQRHATASTWTYYSRCHGNNGCNRVCDRW